MKPINILLAFLVLFLISFSLLCFLEVPPLSTGNLHPIFQAVTESGSPCMLIGGTDIQSAGGHPILAFLFGFSTLCVLCSFVYLGAANNNKLKHYRPYLIGAFVIYLSVFIWQYFSHQEYIDTGHQEFFGGWPTPTAVMIYGMWSAPALIMILYVFNFKRHILSDEDEARFKTILDNRRLRTQN